MEESKIIDELASPKQSLNMYDDTFKWVLKYIKDKKLIRADNILKAKRKEHAPDKQK